MTITLHPADEKAIDDVLAVRPVWSRMANAATVTGIDHRTLLHAGPAFDDPRAVSRPILNSARVCAVFEGIAADFEDAEELILRGEIRLEPAQDHDVVTPLAAVVSASMRLHVVEDAHDPELRSYAPINGGNGPAPRLGLCSDAALAHLRWLHGTLAPTLEQVLDRPLDLIDIAREALSRGDDCHGRTAAATGLVVEQLRESLQGAPHGAAALEFPGDGPGFFLNPWMAACKCMAIAARGTGNSSFVIAAGANGTRTGIQVAGMPGRWFTRDATPPRGRLDEGVGPNRATGCSRRQRHRGCHGIRRHGDTTRARATGSDGEFMPADGLALPGLLLSRIHPAFGTLQLAVGLTARACAVTGRSPVVSLGVLDREGTTGRIGGGIFEPPLSMFEEAARAVD
ncbi:MAG: DUF1116 domain-containing protein [Gammaproteobacteria bacterium]|nr:DUF1116 domain-containing protein [Gammaproteobacteria bacterium]